MNIEYFADLWSKSKTEADLSAAFWDSRADEFNALNDSQENKDRLKLLLNAWQQKELILPESEVLDIGCGPGYISFELSSMVKRVTGCDISPKMIDWAQKRKLDRGVENVSFSRLEWASADLASLGWNKKFDFVFAARCPGLNSRETLEKMVQASKKFCFISSFANMESSLRSELNHLLKGSSEPFSPIGNTIYCAFNILWLMGYFPEIFFYDTGWEKEYTLEYALSMNVKYYEMHGGLSKDQSRLLSSFLEEKAQAGPIKDSVSVKVAWLVWKV